MKPSWPQKIDCHCHKLNPTTSHSHRLNHDNHKKFKLVTNFYWNKEKRKLRQSSRHIGDQMIPEHQHHTNCCSALLDSCILDISHITNWLQPPYYFKLIPSWLRLHLTHTSDWDVHLNEGVMSWTFTPFSYSSFLLHDYLCVDHMIIITSSSFYFPYHSNVPPYLCLSHSDLILLLSWIISLTVPTGTSPTTAV